MTMHEFLEKKQYLKDSFEAAIYATLVKMGPEIQGISWFSSTAAEYNVEKFKKAA